MNIEQAKAIAMTEILKTLNHTPTKENDKDAWYLSPLREEKTASFHVNKQTNEWYDHGIGEGGNSFDFGCGYLESKGDDFTPFDTLRWFGSLFSNQIITPRNIVSVDKKQSKWRLMRDDELECPALIRYLKDRGISFELAKKHLKEVYVCNDETNTKYYALGFKNEDGGFELRNPYFKSCVAPKTITFIRGELSTRGKKPKGVHLFEGFMDYLTYLTIKKRHENDAIVLNSTACMHIALRYIKNYGYEDVYTWLDNDKAGVKATQQLIEFIETQQSLKHRPMNSAYQKHKDLNACHMHYLNLKI